MKAVGIFLQWMCDFGKVLFENKKRQNEHAGRHESIFNKP